MSYSRRVLCLEASRGPVATRVITGARLATVER